MLTFETKYVNIFFSKVEIDALSEQGTGSCPCYEKQMLAVLVSHSVAAIRIFLSFLQYICRKDFYYE